MTARRRQLARAPITEALIDFRVPPATEIPHGAREQLRAHLSQERYPDIAVMGQSEMELQITPPAATVGPVRAIVRGYAAKSADGQRIAQFRLNGFTFNRLRPYDSFEAMRDEALRLWTIYCDIFRPRIIVRTALRYINHLSFPAPVTDLAQYLSAPPAAPPGIEDGHRITGFFSRVATTNPRTTISAVVTQALDQSLQPGQVNVILDIDVYKSAEFQPSDARVTETLSELREMKNNIFFASIGPDGRLSYAGLFGNRARVHGTEYFETELPKSVSDNLRRLLSEAATR